MKILFTADWHIKLGQKNVPIDWQKNRYRLLFNKLESLSETVDQHVIGGDIFDKVPSLDELALFHEFIDKVKIPTIIYDGNHEAVKKDTTFFTVLKPIIKSSNKNIIIIDDYYNGEYYDIIPYCRLKQFEKLNDFEPKNTLLFTHVRGNIEPHVKSEVNLEIFKTWPLVVAGDLHSHSNSQANILYPGSPVTTSAHRKLTSNGGLIVDTADLSSIFIDFELPQLLRKTITEVNEIDIDENYHHIIYEMEGSLDKLSTIDNHLIDKKIVRRSSEASLILTKEMTLSQEVEEYLKYILNLDTEAVERILKTLHDKIKDIKMV